MPRTLDGRLYLRVPGDMNAYAAGMYDPERPGVLLDERWPLTPPGLIPPPDSESRPARRLRIAKAVAISTYIADCLSRIRPDARRRAALEKIINAEEFKERRIYAALGAAHATHVPELADALAVQVPEPVDLKPNKRRSGPGAAMLAIVKASHAAEDRIEKGTPEERMSADRETDRLVEQMDGADLYVGDPSAQLTHIGKLTGIRIGNPGAPGRADFDPRPYGDRFRIVADGEPCPEPPRIPLLPRMEDPDPL